MRKIFVLVTAFITGFGLTSTVFAQNEIAATRGLVTTASAPFALIKSRADLNSYLHANSTTPLSHLSHSAREDFIDSLVFTDRGLASFRYGSLQNELTPSQIFEVLALFGAQRMVHKFSGARMESSLDVQLLAGEPEMQMFCDNVIFEYRCSGMGTCVREWNHACITCNCGIPPQP